MKKLLIVILLVIFASTAFANELRVKPESPNKWGYIASYVKLLHKKHATPWQNVGEATTLSTHNNDVVKIRVIAMNVTPALSESCQHLIVPSNATALVYSMMSDQKIHCHWRE